VKRKAGRVGQPAGRRADDGHAAGRIPSVNGREEDRATTLLIPPPSLVSI
jgi:hypothetical protein